MRVPIPSGLLARWVQRLEGVGPEAHVRTVRIYPRSIELALEHPSGVLKEVHVVPRGEWRWVLLALAPILFVTLAPRPRLYARIGGLPYALDALITTARKRHRWPGPAWSTTCSSSASDQASSEPFNASP